MSGRRAVGLSAKDLVQVPEPQDSHSSHFRHPPNWSLVVFLMCGVAGWMEGSSQKAVTLHPAVDSGPQS